MLSPVEIQNKEFKRSKLGGYNIDEVNEFLDEVLKSYQELINENLSLKDEINTLTSNVEYYRTMESTIQNVLVMADKTAQDTKLAANEKAEEIKKEAQRNAESLAQMAKERVDEILEKGKKEAYELMQKNESTKKQYVMFKAQFNQLLQTQMDMLAQGDQGVITTADEVTKAFATIEEEVVNEQDPFKPLEDNKQDAFYTKEYTPVDNEEE